ncbi:MAG: PAS domain S-box protein [Bacteroidales bacterium]|nr:PAS domain S-box protein [Bacteroidales bacterium]
MSDILNTRDFLELKTAVEELQKARNAAINLIEDLNREIEKRIQYENELKVSEEKFRSLFHDHAAVKFIIDPDTGNIVDANDAAASFYGWGIDELKQMNISQINNLPPDKVKKEMEKARLLKNTHFEFKHRKANGNIVDVEVFSSKVLIGGKEYLHSIIHDITDRKNIESERLKLSVILDNSLSEIYIFNADTLLFEYANAYALRNTGFTEEEIKRITPVHLKPEFTEASFRQLLEPMLRGSEKKLVFQTTHKRKNGTLYPVEVHVNLQVYEKDKVFFAVINDISERKKAEESLRESERNYRELIDGMNETVWVIDFDGKLIDVNNKAVEILGFSKEELLSIGLYGVDISLHREEIKALIDFMPEDKIQIFETSHKTKYGRVFPVEVYSSLVTYQGEKAILSIARDITERKRNEKIQQILYDIARAAAGAKSIEELLTEVRFKLSNLFDTANFYVALYNHDKDTLKKVIFVNEKFDIEEWDVKNSLSGYVIRSGMTLLLTKEERITFAHEHNMELTGIPAECWLGVPLMENEKAYGVLVVQSYTNPSAYDINSARLLEMVAHELSFAFQRKKMIRDLVNAKEKAEESDRLKLAFLANISHEIRTPMNGILGFLDLLQRPNLADDQRDKFIEVVNQSGQRLLATINDIMEISKIESGLVELQYAEINIAEALNYHYEFFKQQALAKHLSFIRKDTVTGNQSLVKTDKHKLDGILSNLLSNALKFTHEGGIEFGNYIKGDELVFYVKDTGIGIPPERLNSIFDRFVQAEQGLTRQYEGSGLGLSIAKAYIEIMKGRIWVESEINKGSTFYFSIPYHPLHKQPESESPATPVFTGKKDKITVLLAEDDEISYEYLEFIIKNEGLNLLHAVNGEDTVKIVRENPSVSLVLMDIKMPGMNGLDATREIRKFNSQIPIIAQTAHALSGDKDKAIEAGCNDYISKPIEADELMLMIDRYTT